jgi:hypothetical protein
VTIGPNASYVGRADVASSEESAALHQCLWAMECAYWDDVDFNAGQLAHEFYCDDAVSMLVCPALV